ncbi:hypothetical protein FPV67DRAFT_1523492 [Lyophyllum atratum]|nr:hypothetical protein FPV67DRAFT_1523492 [Lyophyllum atratum]
MDMPIPTPSPNSDDTEGSVLREFVDASIAREHRSPSLRSELLSQTFHHGKGATVDPGPSKRPRRSHKRRKPQEHELVKSEASPDDLLRLLVDQKQETHTLRRALRIAAERMDSEAQRVVALERNHSQTTEHFRILNESRVTAQQEAMKANSELRLYQFQFENAQKEIARAQEMLKMVEDQRDDAEEAAVRARAKARKYLQERMVAAAREEGRRLGFEDGLRRAQEEQGQRGTRIQRNSTSRRRQVEQDDAVHGQVDEPATNDDVLGDAVDQMSQMSWPIRHALRGRRANASPEVIRVEQPLERNPDSYQIPPSHLRTESETQPEESPPPPEPVPIVHPTPDLPRPMTPSVQYYSVEIPPAAELERQYSLNEYPGRHPQPWVTAKQYSEMTGQEVTPRNSLQPDAENVDLQRGVVTYAPSSASRHRKESWYRTLSRRFGRKRKSQNGGPATSTDQPPQPASWYTPAPEPAPSVLVRDFGMPKPRSFADSASLSTRMSQLDIVSPPGRTPDGSERSFGGGVKPKRKFKDRNSALFVINEDPASRTATPVKGHVPRGSPNMGQRVPLPSQKAPTDTSSNYSNPKVVDEWRRSTVSVPREIPNAHARPPSGPRRPANLTMPGPLSPESARVLNSAQSRTMSHNTQDSGLTGQGSLPRLGRHDTSSLSAIGITVEPPSRSPSEALGSSRPETTLLSPTQIRTPSLHSAPSMPAMPNRPSPQSNYPSSPTPVDAQRRHSRSESVASYARTQPYPVLEESSKSPAYAPQLLPSDRPQSQQWPRERSQRVPVSGVTPKRVDRPFSPMANGGDDISVHSGRHSASQKTPRQSYQNIPSTNPQWGETTRSQSSHRRVVSETHLTPGPSHAGLPHPNGEHTLHRVGSNLSMASADSKYAKYDGAQYLDPAYYPPESVNVNADKGKGVDRRSPIPMQRPQSGSSFLSYVTDPLLKTN